MFTEEHNSGKFRSGIGRSLSFIIDPTAAVCAWPRRPCQMGSWAQGKDMEATLQRLWTQNFMERQGRRSAKFATLGFWRTQRFPDADQGRFWRR